MATFTATGTGGNLSAGTSWVGGVAPGNGTGDVIVVPSGSTILIDQNWDLGATTGTPGPAFTINGTSPSSCGTLQVANGITITFRGVDTASNPLGLINQYGLFQPLTGSTVLGVVAADYASVVLNKGRFEPQSGVLFSVPTANVSWAVQVTGEVKAPGGYDTPSKIVCLTVASPGISNSGHTGLGSKSSTSFSITASSGFGAPTWTEVQLFPITGAANNGAGLIRITAPGHGYSTGASVWVNNVAGTPEANGVWTITVIDANTFDLQSSSARNAYVGGGTVAAVTAPGAYAVNYDAGIIYLYSTSATSLSLTYSYYHLDKTSANWRGWGIVSYGTSTSAQVNSPAPTTGNTFIPNGCTFQYMGASTNTIKTIPNNGWSCQAPIVLIDHYTATATYNSQSGSATTVAYVQNCTFNFCSKWIQLFQCIGAANDPVLITGNTFNDGSGSTFIDGLNFYGSFGRYVKVDSNAVNHRGIFVDLSNVGADVANLSITNNRGTIGVAAVYAATLAGARTPWPAVNDPDASFAVPNTIAGNRPSSPDLLLQANAFDGVGEGLTWATSDPRFLCLSGASAAHPATVTLNVIRHVHRFGNNVGSYVIFSDNVFGENQHHGFTGSVLDGTYTEAITYVNNLFWADRGASNVQAGAVQLGYNHYTMLNNCVIAYNTFDGWKAAVDYSDNVDNTATSLNTNIVVVGNICANGQYCRTVNVRDTLPNLHVLEDDYNVNYNPATTYALNLNNTTVATGFYSGSSKYNRLGSGGRNILGVSLFDASYTTAQAGRSLVYTVNTLGADHTLMWGAGSPVQLIADHQTSGGGGIRTVAVPGNTTLAVQNTGTLSLSVNSNAVTGVGTLFTTELQAGDYLRTVDDTVSYKVANITSDLALTLTSTALANHSAKNYIRHRTDSRLNFCWIYAGTGAGQSRGIYVASPNVAYAVAINAGGSGYSVGQYLTVNIGSGTYDFGGSSSPFGNGARVILKVTAVSGGVVTGLQIVSGGMYIVTPGTTALATTRITGSAGASCTVNISWAPGLLVAPDFSTAVDATSQFAIVKANVSLSDGASGTVKAGIYPPDPANFLTATLLPTTSQTDAGITVAVNHSPTGNPNWIGTFPGGVPTGIPTDYMVVTGGSGIDAGTTDNAPTTDFFGTARPQQSTYDIGFFEYNGTSFVFAALLGSVSLGASLTAASPIPSSVSFAAQVGPSLLPAVVTASAPQASSTVFAAHVGARLSGAGTAAAPSSATVTFSAVVGASVASTETAAGSGGGTAITGLFRSFVIHATGGVL